MENIHQPFYVTKEVTARVPRHWFPSRIQTHDARSVLIGSANPPKHIPRGFDTGRAHRSNGLICRRRYGAGWGWKRSLAMHTWPCKFLELNAWSAWSIRCLTYNQQRACNLTTQATIRERPCAQTSPLEHHRPCAQMRPQRACKTRPFPAPKRDMLIVLPSPLLSLRLLKHIALVAFRPE